MGPNHVGQVSVEELHRFLERALNGVDYNDDNAVADRIIQVFQTFDQYLYDRKRQFGTTCTLLLIDTDRHKLYQVNLGDSRSIIFDDFQIRAETADHDPENPEEAQRIKNAGGFVMYGRVNGNLALSRAFGDFEFKRHNYRLYDPVDGMVSAVPTVTVTHYAPTDHLQFILTSDAPFERDAFNNQSLVALARAQLAKHPGDYSAAAAGMVAAIAPRTTDDTTIVIGRI